MLWRILLIFIFVLNVNCAKSQDITFADNLDYKNIVKMNSIKRGAQIYLNTCVKCHEISDVKYQDLIDIGVELESDIDRKMKIVSEGLMEQNINLISLLRSKGARYILNILKGYRKNKDGSWYMKNGLYYNYFFNDNYFQMPPILTDEVMMGDTINFLEWVGDRHADLRFKVGLKVMVFLLVLLVFLGVFLVFYDN